MTFIQLLDALKNPESLTRYRVIAFQGSEYPLLFFSLLGSRLKAANVPFEAIDCAEHDSSFLEAKFQTSFLGQQLFFWLKNSESLSDRMRKWLFKFVADYQGPHTIMFFAPADALLTLNKESVLVIIPHALDGKTLTSLALCFNNGTSNAAQAVTTLCKGRESISVDKACLLMHYAQLLGAHTQQFTAQWLDKIITTDHSLFTVSAHFLGKKPKAFFEMLMKIDGHYSGIFWVSYWSDILWRAYHYVSLTQAKQFNEAKKISNRLPFTFIQRDWKLHKAHDLKNAHNQLYAIDFALKNGASEGILDLFYAQYFNRTSS